MSLASRELAGYISRAAWYQLHGYDFGRFQDFFGNLAAGENLGIIQTLWNEGTRAANAGFTAREYYPLGNMPAGYVPGYRPGKTGYRYGIVGYYTRSDGEVERSVFHQEDRTEQASMADLESIMRSMTPPPDTTGSPPRVIRGVSVTYTFSHIEIVSLERWQV